MANNSRIKRFRASLASTKVTSNPLSLYAQVILPEFEDDETVDLNNPDKVKSHSIQIENEWVAENIVDFVQDISMTYSIFAMDNDRWEEMLANPEKLENKGYPRGVDYKWQDNAKDTPQTLKLDGFLEKSIEWVEAATQNEDIFPSEDETPFKDDFIATHAREIMTKLLRVFAIILCNPVLSGLDAPADTQSEASKNFQKTTTRFIAFGVHWDLFVKDELTCIESVYEKVMQSYNKTKAEFLAQNNEL